MASIICAFSSTIALEMAGYFTQNVPPKPQHVVLPFQRSQRQTVDASKEPTWLGFDAKLAQAGATIVVRRGGGQ